MTWLIVPHLVESDLLVDVEADCVVVVVEVSNSVDVAVAEDEGLLDGRFQCDLAEFRLTGRSRGRLSGGRCFGFAGCRRSGS